MEFSRLKLRTTKIPPGNGLRLLREGRSLYHKFPSRADNNRLIHLWCNRNFRQNAQRDVIVKLEKINLLLSTTSTKFQEESEEFFLTFFLFY